VANSVSLHHRLPSRGGVPPIMGFRLAFTLCAIIVFTVQSCVLQAHIHPANAAAVTPNLASHAGQLIPGGREDGDECPLCQAFALAGAFVTPGAVLFHRPSLQFLTAWIPVGPSVNGRTAQFHWRSRAPPTY
jgi:hypothetical protein